MAEQNYLKDISDIKALMNRSSRFLSLSGMAGILAGCYALAGAFGAYYFLFPKRGQVLYVGSWEFRVILVVLAVVLLLSVGTAAWLTTRKAKRNGEKIWDATTRRLLVNFLVPLVTGGLYILIKLNSQHYGLTASLMLIFYGLALINAAKYTFGHVAYLGAVQIVLGLVCAALPGYGFWFWIVGFGLMHILYGAAMYFWTDSAH